MDLIQNQQPFDLFCKAITKSVLSSKILREDEVAIAVKTAILLNLEDFLFALLDEVNAKKLKERLRLMDDFQKSKIGARAYKALTRKIGKIQMLAPIIKTAKNKASIVKRNEEAEAYHKLSAYLRENGHSDLLDSFLSDQEL